MLETRKGADVLPRNSPRRGRRFLGFPIGGGTKRLDTDPDDDHKIIGGLAQESGVGFVTGAAASPASTVASPAIGRLPVGQALRGFRTIASSLTDHTLSGVRAVVIIGIVGVVSVFVTVRPHFLPTTARTLKSSNAKC